MVVPCVAARHKPRDIVIDKDPDFVMTYVEREDIQEFPADFFYRYTCSNEGDIKKYGEKFAIWQDGMVLAVEGASALIELIRNTRIEITVWGDNKQDYLKKLERLIDDLLVDYRFTSYEGERRKGNKIIKTIVLVVVEAVSILSRFL